MSQIEPGSTLYYSLLWTDPESKDRFVNRMNLVLALNGTLDDVQDPEVAQKKIHWWHEELERMVNGEARHPATKACQTSVSRVAIKSDQTTTNPAMLACLAVLSSVSDVRFTPPNSMEDRDRQLVKNFTARLALLSHALSNDVNDLEINSHPAIAAEGLAKHEQLQRLPALLHRGHAVFSDDTYKSHGITPSDLAKDVRVADDAEPNSNKLNGVIPIIEEKAGKLSLTKAAIEDTHASLLKASVHPSVSKRYRQGALLPIWRLIILRRKQLELWESKQPNLLRENMALTPLTKFFHAWRNRR